MRFINFVEFESKFGRVLADFSQNLPILAGISLDFASKAREVFDKIKVAGTTRNFRMAEEPETNPTGTASPGTNGDLLSTMLAYEWLVVTRKHYTNTYYSDWKTAWNK